MNITDQKKYRDIPSNSNGECLEDEINVLYPETLFPPNVTEWTKNPQYIINHKARKQNSD